MDSDHVPAQGPSGTPPALMKAVRKLLHPLVRLLLAQGVQYPHIADLLKSVFVGVAYDEFKVEGRRQSQSRISLLTGIHRKDVRRLLAEDRHPDQIPMDLSLGVQIAAKWLSDPAYQNATGGPAPLARLASAGAARSFESLVASVSKDIRSRVVLDEWMRLGVVEPGPDDTVNLKTSAFVPAKGMDEKLFFLGQNIADHLSTAVGNVTGNQPTRLERAVFYEGLSEESVAKLSDLAQKRGMALLVDLNREAQKMQERDTAAGQGKLRMNFGVYFYEGPTNEGDKPDGQ